MNDSDAHNQNVGQNQDMWDGTASLAEEIDRLRAELIAFLASNIDKPESQGALIPQRMVDAIDAQAKAAIARHLEGSALANPQDFAGKVMAATQPHNDQIRQDVWDLKSQIGLLSTQIAALTNGIGTLGNSTVATPDAPTSIADEQAALQIKAAKEMVRGNHEPNEHDPDDQGANLPQPTIWQKLALPLTGLGGVIVGGLACWALLTVLSPEPKRDNVPPGTTAIESPNTGSVTGTDPQADTGSQSPGVGNGAAAIPPPATDTAPASGATPAPAQR